MKTKNTNDELPCANCGHAESQHTSTLDHTDFCSACVDAGGVCLLFTRPAPAKIERDVVERAKAHWVAAAACFDVLRQPRDLDETMIGMLASFAAAETADLNAKLDAVREVFTKAIDDEPELPDGMPDEMWQAICGIVDIRDRPTMQELLRITVRTTKRCIQERAKAILNNDAKDSPERA